MKEPHGRRIISITSSGAEQPIPSQALSSGIRSAVVGWFKTLAAEVAADGITVNVVMPDPIHTTRVDEFEAAAAKRTRTEVAASRAPPSRRAAMASPRNSPTW